MDYKLVEKPEFKVMGVSRIFDYDTSSELIPKFWTEHYKNGGGKKVCGLYGVCIAHESKDFEYMIADNYSEEKGIPEGCECRTIPAGTWAVFPCRGAMPRALQKLNEEIYSNWLPNCRDYELAGAYNIEMYTDVRKYKKGNQSEDFYTEIWLPVKKK